MKITIDELGIKDKEVDRKIKFLKQSFIIKDEIKKIADFESSFLSRIGTDKAPSDTELMDYSYEDSKKTIQLVEKISDFIANTMHLKNNKRFNEKIENLDVETAVIIFEKIATAMQIGDVELNSDSVANANEGKE